jgi:radical SAM-linked protein
MLGDKLRFRFSKAGTLRLLSHHDLMRCLERILRRAVLPFKSTAGFHPTPRVVFALSLPLGVEGRDELVEVELTRPCDSDEVLAKLNEQAPAGLVFTRASVVPMKATAIPRRVVYTLPIPVERVEPTEARCRDLMATDKVWVDRLRPGPKRLNIRPYFRSLSVVRSLRERASEPLAPRADYILELDLWVTQTGTARADELVRLLGLTDLLDEGAVLERTVVELRDEVPTTDPSDAPPDGPAETLPLDPAAVAAAARGDESQPAAAHWGASPSGPVVE